MVTIEALQKVKTCSSDQAQYLRLSLCELNFTALVVAFKADGLLLCLPALFDFGLAAEEFPEIFLGHISVLYEDSEDFVIADCSLEVARSLSKVSRTAAASFVGVPFFEEGDDGSVGWPVPTKVLSKVLTARDDSHDIEDFFTAGASVLPELRKLTDLIGGLQNRVGMLEERRGAGQASQSSTDVPPQAPHLRKGDALQAGRQLVGPAPTTRATRAPPQPVTEVHMAAGDTDEEDGDASVDTNPLFQATLLKFMRQMDSKMEGSSKRKPRKSIVGLEADEEEEEEDAEESGKSFLGLKGSKGVMQAERLRASMGKEPKAFLRKMESLLAQAVDEEQAIEAALRKFERSMPLGQQRILGFMTHAVVETLVLLQNGRTDEGRLLLLQVLAMVETFCLDEDFTLAWKLTHLSQPPWSAWKQVDLQTFRRENDYSRLQSAVWNSAYMGEVNDHQHWQARRKGLGKGKKDKDAKSGGAPKEE
eukprot:TRINITY_DN11717_c0_g1_i1.p1 TRINITY_DN11717_c0_g1~~TRINITY_DN11717_c0_g1_i1.p1  ORF type:complete len:477 (+),score=113.79 TRINITY_DN11717_c0_g1_i1:310-1740(+)